MEIETFAPAVGESDVVAFERRIGARLPSDYRSFLLTYNGGEPRPDCFAFADRTGPYTNGAVRAFAALWDGFYSNLNALYRTYCEYGRVPKEVIPIATDEFGNVICLAVRGSHVGRVFFWDHERESDLPTYDNMDRIADSFTEFLDCLKPAKPLPRCEGP